MADDDAAEGFEDAVSEEVSPAPVQKNKGGRPRKDGKPPGSVAASAKGPPPERKQKPASEAAKPVEGKTAVLPAVKPVYRVPAFRRRG